MKKILVKFISLVTVILIAVSCYVPCYATVEDNVGMNMDVVFVIDASNSMLTAADPNKRALEAFKLFVDYIDAQSCRVGYVVYTHQIKGKKDLTAINTDSSISEIRNDISKISYDIEGDTDISLGLKEAMNIFEKDNQTDRKQLIVLLTDGNTHIISGPRTESQSKEELKQLLPILNAKDIPVYSIGLNYDGSLDQSEIANISNSTQGKYFVVGASSDISSIIHQIVADFNETKPEDLEVDANGNVEINIENESIFYTTIEIESEKSESELQPTLTSPGGSKVLLNSGNIKKVSSQGHILIKMLYPDAGTWVLHLNGATSKNCKIHKIDFYSMMIKQTVKSQAIKGDKVTISASLYDKDGIVKDADLLNEIEMVTTVKGKSGNQEVQLKNDGTGNFTGSFIPANTGEYEIQTKAIARQFNKTSSGSKLVVKDILESNVSLVQKLSSSEITIGEFVTITAEFAEDSLLNDLVLTCSVKDKDNQVLEELPLKKTENNVFEAIYTPKEKGVYKFITTAKADGNSKQSEEEILNVVRKSMQVIGTRNINVQVRSAPLITSYSIPLNEHIRYSSEDIVNIEFTPASSEFFNIETTGESDNLQIIISGLKGGSERTSVKVKNQFGEEVVLNLNVEVQNAWTSIAIIIAFFVLFCAIVAAVYFILRPKMKGKMEITILLPPNTQLPQPTRQTLHLPKKHKESLNKILSDHRTVFSSYQEVIRELKLNSVLNSIIITSTGKDKLKVTVKNSGVTQVDGRAIEPNEKVQKIISNRARQCEINYNGTRIIIAKQ